MSDGNFNTKLLAPGGYASGVRAGEARMKQHAINAFAETIDATDCIDAETKEELKRTYKVRLDKSTLGK